MQWLPITDIILASSIAVLAVFAILGLAELINRKSIKKVDRELLAFPVPLALMTIVYFVFDKIWILNTRPNGSGESSFPSTHAMVTATIFFCTMFALPKYVKSKPLRIFLDIIMLILIAVVAVGRVLANQHWPMDTACGVVFALVFAGIYYLIIKKKPQKKESENE